MLDSTHKPLHGLAPGYLQDSRLQFHPISPIHASPVPPPLQNPGEARTSCSSAMASNQKSG